MAIGKMVMLAGAAAMGLALATAGSEARADEAEFVRYHSAIKAAEMCLGQSHGQAEWEQMTAVIHERASTGMATGSDLSLIDQAQGDTYWTVFKWGCKSDRVGELIELYQADLAPALAG